MTTALNDNRTRHEHSLRFVVGRSGRPTAPKRLLADFLIGSHALLQADRLLTLAPTHYKRDFPELQL